jgi:hypothetical protein
LGLLPLLAAVSVFEATAYGQGARVDPYQGGAAPAFPGAPSAAAMAQQQAAASVSAAAAQQYANTMAADPMAPMLMYGGVGMPMTRGQAGLSAISSLQQMSGIGSGRISGVRGGRRAEARTAAHTRNANIVGGQASRFFNRVEPRRPGAAAVAPVTSSAGAGNSRRFYQRPSRYFPEPAQ